LFCCAKDLKSTLAQKEDRLVVSTASMDHILAQKYACSRRTKNRRHGMEIEEKEDPEF
jgi:hypothetical protein